MTDQENSQCTILGSLALENTELADEIAAINAIFGPDTAIVTATTKTPTTTSTSNPNPNPTSNSTTTTTTPTTLDLGSPATPNTLATIQIPNHPNLSFVVGFDATYPETPPRVVKTASTSSRGEGKVAVDVLHEIVGRIHQPGWVCLFEVISEAAEVFEELRIGRGEDDVKRENENGERGESIATGTGTGTAAAAAASTRRSGSHSNDPTEQLDFATLSLRDTFGLDSPPDWILSEVVTEKKSVFVGRAAHVTSPEQAQAFIDYLLSTEKKVAAATHNISAWRIRQKKQQQQQQQQQRPTASTDGSGGGAGNRKNNETAGAALAAAGESTYQDCDDDGETAAGGRLLHLMQLMDVWNVVVVVTRWYGGIKLGPDRFRIINAVGRDALVKGGFNREEAAANNNEKGKKKGKK